MVLGVWLSLRQNGGLKDIISVQLAPCMYYCRVCANKGNSYTCEVDWAWDMLGHLI